jgi:hypothetical protein
MRYASPVPHLYTLKTKVDHIGHSFKESDKQGALAVLLLLKNHFTTLEAIESGVTMSPQGCQDNPLFLIHARMNEKEMPQRT